LQINESSCRCLAQIEILCRGKKTRDRKEFNQMKQYKSPVLMHEPSDEKENKYMADIPMLPGCRAWGDAPAETLIYVQSAAAKCVQEQEHALQSSIGIAET